MLLGYAAARSPTLFQALGGEATFGDARVRRMTVFFAAIIFFTFGAFSLEMSRASYCLAPSHIWVRPWPWQEMRRFRWQDVGLVGASCTYGKGWSATLRLYMRSGEVIEIPHSQIAESFYSIKRALRGLRVDVDKRDINPDCDVPEKDLLLQLN